jgi:hypothetical protein
MNWVRKVTNNFKILRLTKYLLTITTNVKVKMNKDDVTITFELEKGK